MLIPKSKTFSLQCLVAATAVIATVTPGHALVKKPQNPAQEADVAVRYPVLTAPLLKTAPNIDGAINVAEWGGAAQSAPLVSLSSGIATDEAAVSWVGYTPQALYIAFHFDRPPSALVPIAGEDPMKVWADDAVELFLRPEFDSKIDYDFVGNAAGVHEEGRRSGNTDKSWTANWKYAARRTATGWEGEMEIPFAAFGASTPAPGTTWEMNLFSNRKSPRGEIAAWSFMKNWYALEDFGYLVFGGEVPAARVLQAGAISRNEVGVLLEVSNFTAKDATLQVQSTLLQPKREDLKYFDTMEVAANPLGAQAEAKEQIPASEVMAETLKSYDTLKQENRTMQVPAGQSRRVLLAQPSTRGSYVVQYRVSDPQSGMLLNAGALPFFRRAPIEIEATPFILGAGVVQVTTDYRKVPGVQEGDKLVLQWRDGDKVLQEKTLPVNVQAQQTVADIPVKGLAAGRYQINARITGPDGANRGERAAESVLPAIPEWWGNDIGKPEVKDIVPEPWTPMKKTVAGFDVWNRKIDLGTALQPSQITAATASGQSTPMLARPISLDMKAAGLTISQPEVTKDKKTGISYRQAIKGQGFTGELVMESEFDGFMKYSLRLTPQGTADLDHLVLDIPLKPGLATYFRHGDLGTPVSQAENEGTYGYGAVKGDMSLPFTDTVWLGNDEMGFEWSAESDQWWTPDNDKQAVQILRGPDATTLRINFVNKPRNLNQPVQYQWAILPTPVKPMNEELLHQLRLAQGGWRLDKDLKGLRPGTDQYIDALLEADVNAFCNFGWGADNVGAVWNPEGWSAPNYRLTSELDKTRQQAFRQANDMAYKKGMRWSIAYNIFSSVFPDWPNVGDLWKEQAIYPYVPSLNGTYIFCPTPAFADWFISEQKKMIETTHINGVYEDSSVDPRICSQPQHDHGYTDENGVRHGTYPVFEMRDFQKRIYMLFHGEATAGGLIYAHNSHFPFMAIESFVDVHHCGEGSDLNRDYLIPKFYGRPFGLPVSFTRWNHPPYPETRMKSWRVVLQLDSTIKAHPAYVISSKVDPEDAQGLGRERAIKGYDVNSLVVYKIWQAQKNFPYEQAQWIPFWKAAPYAQTGDEDMLPCMHLVPGKQALVVVSSFKDKPQMVNLKLDWKEMGFDWQKVKLVDSITDEVLQPTAEGVTLEVLDNRWRMFSIKSNP
jgi:hypothetical protein